MKLQGGESSDLNLTLDEQSLHDKIFKQFWMHRGIHNPLRYIP